MKKTIIIILLFLCFITNAQTSIFEELTADSKPIEYSLNKGSASKIIVKTNYIYPESKLSYHTKHIYNIIRTDSLELTIYTNKGLHSISEYSLDSVDRIIFKKVKIKNDSFGLENTNTKIIYDKNNKEFLVFNYKGDLKHKMIVEFDSLKFPIKITKINNLNEIEFLTTALYDYLKGSCHIKTLRSDGLILYEKIIDFNSNKSIKKNKFGDIIEMYWPTTPISFNIILKWVYKYDNSGNWIKKTRIRKSINGEEIQSVTKRKIKYKN